QQGSIVVVHVFPDTPAEGAGIMDGDQIIGIDTLAIHGWSSQQVSDALIGTIGTRVTVRFARPGVAQPLVHTFTRAEIHVPAVPYALLLADHIAYIPLQVFNENSADELTSAVNRLTKQGAKSIILDLRDNPGGILDQGLAIGDLFLKQGQEIASVRTRQGPPQDHDRALVVGTTSFGKGLVQTVFPLDDGWALKLTTGKWYTPSGRSIQKNR